MSAPTPSDEQRRAIEAPLGPVLVIAGPGAGKTFCLVERIRHLIVTRQLAPQRICAFTFTNKAAHEIGERLSTQTVSLGGSASCGTIHAFCARLLREHADALSIPRGFGIADERYQSGVLHKCGVWEPRQQKGILMAFTRHRFRGDPLDSDHARLLQRYEAYLAQHNVLDFDQLVRKAGAAMELDAVRDAVRAQYDYVLVDEFQDLSGIAFDFVRRLVPDGGHLYAVGDDEQSIYSWAGADLAVFETFAQHYPHRLEVQLNENRRCPTEVMQPARRMIGNNRRRIGTTKEVRATRRSPHQVTVHHFADADEECDWLLDDIRREQARAGLAWGDIAVLYRVHAIGKELEAAFLASGMPCRVATGRALAEEPVVAYLLAALRCIAHPKDALRHEEFARTVLSQTLYDEARRRANHTGEEITRSLRQMANARRRSEDAAHINRALVELRNLAALGERHTHLPALVAELLSHRVGRYSSALGDLHQDLSDPDADPAVRALARDLEHAAVSGRPVAIAPMQGLELPLRLLFHAAERADLLTPREHPHGPLTIGPSTTPHLGPVLGVFKALQLMVSGDYTDVFTDFVALDFETTGKHPGKDRITEVGAVRIRSGVIVQVFETLVNPGIEIPPEVAAKTGITDEMVKDRESFAEVWPRLREFLGTDLLVAHNGHSFDFIVLQRELERLGQQFEIHGFDTLPLAREVHPGSRTLEHLARAFGVDPGQSHRALDDARTLAQVVPALMARKRARSRKTALSNALDPLAVGLALTSPRCAEAERLFERIRVYPLFPHARALGAWREAREREGHPDWPTPQELIERLGGERLLTSLQREKDADDRYPELMARLRRVLAAQPPGRPLAEQLELFLETVVLSKSDVESDRDRVNLLTLHSTKGLEFSHVYIVGASNNEIVMGNPEYWTPDEVEEARRLLYVGMTRTRERLVLTVAAQRGKTRCEDHGFIGEMGDGLLMTDRRSPAS